MRLAQSRTANLTFGGIAALAALTLGFHAQAQSGLTGELELEVFGESGGSRGPQRSMKEVEFAEARESGSHFVDKSRLPHTSSVTHPDNPARCARVVVPNRFLADFRWVPNGYWDDEYRQATVTAAVIYYYLYSVGAEGDKDLSDAIFLALLADAGTSEETQRIAREEIVEAGALQYGEPTNYKYNPGRESRPLRAIPGDASVIRRASCPEPVEPPAEEIDSQEAPESDELSES